MKRGKTILILSTLAVASIHILNRIEYSHATSKNVLTNSDNQFYEWRFGKIRYTKKGTGSPLLLLHDLAVGSSSYEFHKLIDSLSKNHEVYCLDFLGYGLSDKPNITFTNYIYVQMVTDFIKNVIGKRTDIIATGDAFPIAVMVCHNENETVNKLIAINPQSLYNLNQIPSKQTRILKLLLDTPVIGTFIYNMQSTKSAIQKTFREKYFYNPYNTDDKDIDSYFEAAHLTDHNSKHAFASCVGRYTNTNILHALKEINNSIYIIAGKEEEDIEITVDNYKYYNNAIEAHFIDYTKHLPHLERYREVLDSLELFLD